MEIRAVTAETKAVVVAATGATTLTEPRDLVASKLGDFQRHFVNSESTAEVCHDYITRQEVWHSSRRHLVRHLDCYHHIV